MTLSNLTGRGGEKKMNFHTDGLKITAESLS